VRRGHRATGQGGVTVVVVPRAVLALVAVRVSAVRGQDHVVGVPVGRGGGVAEVRGGVDRLDTQLVTAGGLRLGDRVVIPDAGEHATGLVRDVLGAGGRAAGGVGGHVAVTPLGQVGRPQRVVGADALEHLLGDAGRAGRVVEELGVAVGIGGLGTPLVAVEDHVRLAVPALHADAVDAAAV